jgi:nitronate monooxygenase
MAIPASLNKNLALPVICAPMFIVSNPDLVIAQCKSGVIGSFPALNARPKELLDEWLTRIKSELADDPECRAVCGQPDHPPVQRAPGTRHGAVREA